MAAVMIVAPSYTPAAALAMRADLAIAICAGKASLSQRSERRADRGGGEIWSEDGKTRVVRVQSMEALMGVLKRKDHEQP